MTQTRTAQLACGLAPLGLAMLALALAPACKENPAPVEQPRAETRRAESPSAKPAGVSLEKSAATFAATRFTDSKHWFDGKAEVAVYKASRIQYGKPRSFDLRMIHVSEEHNPEKYLKADDPSSTKTLPTMKTHIVFEMPTKNYPYNFATSVFTNRENPFQLRKLVSTSHEWCGITTKRIETWHDRPQLKYHSYFESEASGSQALDWPKGGLLEEQLFLATRALPFGEEGYSRPVQILDRQISSHAPPARWREGTLTIAGRETIKDARDKSHEVWNVKVALKNGDELLYKIGVDHPHHLIYHQAPGVMMRLDEVKRWAYWSW